MPCLADSIDCKLFVTNIHAENSEVTLHYFEVKEIPKGERMKIRQYMDELSGWDSDDRERYLRPLLAILSPVSVATLQEHQRKHYVDHLAFVDSQNKSFLQCLTLEMSENGAIVRQKLGLELLTLDTEIVV